ncbi:type IV pilus assembly protein FimV [Aquella oligotrophica]|uniref:FimV N-terminal domain-containing protein n=1 Tax=Aquella oligotrophica TaxID=2067065 RepID=A0A2I7N5L0_9NEIS|nr:hypothetical protein [Aquella oligotrophica]AUR51756.1 hypothetical protein CUN60_05410 [Aquella oligotrophica]
MRRFILLVLASLMYISSSYADLGDIKVNSYLSQRFDAVVPLTNMPKDTDYNNLHLGLANSKKFKEYGINFNPELGSFVFQIITNSKAPYVKITSSKLINSPVLSFLLHYRINNDDFYRQYTVLLDPVDYTSTTQAKQDNKLIVVRDNQTSHRVGSNEKPIPIYSKVATTNIQKPSFQMDLSNPSLQASLARFNQESMLYTTVTNDSLYNIAKFNQAIYPKAQLTINQILIALGMENYHLMHNAEYLYESNVLIKIPLAKNISLIPANLADAYLLDVSLSNDQKFGILKAIASKYNRAVNIESAELFVVRQLDKKTVINNLNSSQNIRLHSQHKDIKPATKPADDGLLSFILANSLYLFGGLVIVLILVVLRKRYPDISLKDLLNRLKRKRIRKKLDAEEDPNSDDNIYGDLNKFSHHRTLSRHQFEAFDQQNEGVEPQASPLPDVNQQIATEKEVITKQASSDENAKLPATPKSEFKVDHELLETLEKILLMDPSRDDIRYKLFELYLMDGKVDKASKIFYALDHNLEIDDVLRQHIEIICQKYDFMPIPESELTDNAENLVPPESKAENLISSESSPLTDVDNYIQEVAHTDHDLNQSAEETNRVVDFISFAPIQNTPDPDEVVSFSQERMLDFSVVDFKPLTEPVVEMDSIDENHSISISAENPISSLIPEEAESIIISEDNTLDEKLNLARMYFHIEESDKAKDIIRQILDSPALSDNLREEVNKLRLEMGLNG